MKRVSFVLGILLLFESVFLIVSTAVALIYQESFGYLVLSFLITAATGAILTLAGRNDFRQLTNNEGYSITGASWLLFAVFGMFPYYLGGFVPTLTDAFFESLSGFTATGLSVINDIESKPCGILFWRSVTQWVGGLGILVTVIAFLPNLNGMNKQLFLTETTNVTYHKISSGTGRTSLIIIVIYATLTLLAGCSLFLSGMCPFDAVCHSFSAVSTGGFSTKNAGIAYWNIPVIEIILGFFMFISGINFALICKLAKKETDTLVKDDELKWYYKTAILFIVLVAGILTATETYDGGTSLRKSFFFITSAISSNGLPNGNIGNWTPFLQMLLLVILAAGSCTGSAGGGIKYLRIMIMVKNIRNQFRLLFNPNIIYSVNVNKTALQPQIFATAFIFVIIFIFFVFAGWVVLLAVDVSFDDGIKAVMAAICNSGPGIMSFTDEFSMSALPDVAKWILSFLMLAGRHEILGLLLLFYRGFWKGNV